MKNILIDTCSWIDLLTEDDNKLLPHLEFWHSNKCLKFITHEIIIAEWNKHKELQRNRFRDSLNTKYRHFTEINKRENLHVPRTVVPRIEHIDEQIRTIDKILSECEVLSTPAAVKAYSSDRVIPPRKAPFHNKVDSTKDAYIIFSALDFFRLQKQGFIFISANTDEFGAVENKETILYPELLEDYGDVDVTYFAKIGWAISELKKELPVSLEITSDTGKQSAGKQDTIIIERKGHILDQLYGYVITRKNQLLFTPHNIFIRNYPFRDHPNFNPYYSIFTVTTDNPLLMQLFNSIKIENERVLFITDHDFFKGVENYETKLKEILTQLTRNLIFNIAEYKTREKIAIRYVEDVTCNCINCIFNRYLFEPAIEELAHSPEPLYEQQKQAYVCYKFGRFAEAATLLNKAYLQAKTFLPVQAFVIQFNLSKLYLFTRHQYRTEPGMDELISSLKAIDVSGSLRLLGTAENSKLLSFISDNDFYNDAREEMQATVNKITDHYYSQLNGGWSNNNHLWDLINQFASLISFIEDNHIMYDAFKEFRNLANLLTEGLFASHAVEETQPSRLDYFDDWMLFQIINYGDAELINKYFRRYKLKTLQYRDFRDNPDSIFKLLDNFLLKNEQLPAHFRGQTYSQNRFFLNYYNRVFANLITVVSLLDLTAEQSNDIAVKLADFINGESLIHASNVKCIALFIDRAGTRLNTEVLGKLLDLGLKKSMLHEDDYFQALVDALTQGKAAPDITEEQYQMITDISFGQCPVCGQAHSTTLAIPLYQLLKSAVHRKGISFHINQRLEANFDFPLYYLSSILDIIPFSETLFEKALAVAYPSGNRISFKSIFSEEPETRFDWVNHLINLCFKYKIDTTATRFEQFAELNDYYNWLLNMESFDYGKFVAQWPGEYATRFYYQQIAASDATKTWLDLYLKTNHDDKVEQSYFNIYIRKTWDKE